MRALQLTSAFLLTLGMTLTASAGQQPEFQQGTPKLKMAGPLTFGDHGILFIGDAQTATIFAIQTGDEKKSEETAPVNVSGIKQKVADMLGTKADQVLINDMAVNPLSGNVYLSVSRGLGPDAMPVIIKVDGTGKLSEFSLKDVKFSQAALPNAPEDKEVGQGNRTRNPRRESITDLAYLDGRLVVAGLSNEEFASNLRAIPFPFTEVDRGSSIEIYHGAHGQLETRSPVRTFVAMNIGGEPQLVAAYTCTPLVRIPLSEMKPGTKIQGTTVAELGNRNRPLDMIAYMKDGKRYLLLANSARGVMKISTDEIESRESINQRVNDTAGQPYETLKELQGVTQLDQLGNSSAIVLIETEDGKTELRTIDLP